MQDEQRQYGSEQSRHNANAEKKNVILFGRISPYNGGNTEQCGEGCIANCGVESFGNEVWQSNIHVFPEVD